MSAGNVEGLNPQFVQRLEALIGSAPGGLSVSSGFRSVERQQQLWNGAVQKYGSEAAARKWVAPPGKSRHNHGIAADLQFADQRTRSWVHQNAARFGLYFPMPWEPWHIEPIGKFADFDPESMTEPPTAVEDPQDRAMRFITLALGSPEGDPLALDDSINFSNDDLEEMFFVEGEPPPGGGLVGGGSVRAGERRTTKADNVVRMAAQAGFSGQSLVTAVAIAFAESGLNAAAVGDTSLANRKWGPSLGLWQIRSLRAENGRGSPRDASKLMNPLFNAKAAFAISGGGSDFSPWSVFKSGTYRQFLGQAQQAVQATGLANRTVRTTRGSTAGRFAI